VHLEVHSRISCPQVVCIEPCQKSVDPGVSFDKKNQQSKRNALTEEKLKTFMGQFSVVYKILSTRNWNFGEISNHSTRIIKLQPHMVEPKQPEYTARNQSAAGCCRMCPTASWIHSCCSQPTRHYCDGHIHMQMCEYGTKKILMPFNECHHTFRN
jgi:hypothetical protein